MSVNQALWPVDMAKRVSYYLLSVAVRGGRRRGSRSQTSWRCSSHGPSRGRNAGVERYHGALSPSNIGRLRTLSVHSSRPCTLADAATQVVRRVDARVTASTAARQLARAVDDDPVHRDPAQSRHKGVGRRLLLRASRRQPTLLDKEAATISPRSTAEPMSSLAGSTPAGIAQATSDAATWRLRSGGRCRYFRLRLVGLGLSDFFFAPLAL